MSVVVVLLVVALVALSLAYVLGPTPDTTRPGREWYPAGPDAQPWRTD
jgi:hypothetical protein